MPAWSRCFCWLLPFAGLASPRAGGFDNALRRVDQVLRAAYPADQPGAAVLIAQGDRVLLRRGYGLSELEPRIKMRPERQFRIASISKQFTAVAVLQLVAAGRLHLEDDAAAYAPEFFAQLPGVHITIRELLTHTSGLKNYSDLDEFRNQPTRTLSVDDLLGMVAHHGLRFAPGTGWEYSNTGYLLLGAIVQRVSGEPFADYLRVHVLAPAGLVHTRVGSAETGEGPDIAGYSPVIGRRGEFKRAVTLNLSQAFGAGQLISSVDDLWRWERAVEAGKVLDQKWVAAARTPVVLSANANGAASTASVLGEPAPPFGDNHWGAATIFPYGYGWELETVAHHATVGHGGTLSGYRSYEIEVPDLGLYIAILCNCDRPQNDPASVAGRVVGLLD